MPVSIFLNNRCILLYLDFFSSSQNMLTFMQEDLSLLCATLIKIIFLPASTAYTEKLIDFINLQYLHYVTFSILVNNYIIANINAMLLTLLGLGN